MFTKIHSKLDQVEIEGRSFDSRKDSGVNGEGEGQWSEERIGMSI